MEVDSTSFEEVMRILWVKSMEKKEYMRYYKKKPHLKP